MYTGGRAFYIAWIVSALCIFLQALWTRFREPVEKPALNSIERAAEYKVKHNYFRLLISWLAGAFLLFMVWAIVVLTITEMPGLSIWFERVLLLAWHAILLWKVPLPALRALFNDPLAISQSGVSIYGRSAVPWEDMVQIKIFTHRWYKQERSLVIALSRSSAIKGFPAWYMIPLRNMRPVVYLPLNDTHCAVEDIISAINHYGLEARDPVAAKRIQESLVETGFIETRNSTQATLSDAGNDPVSEITEQEKSSGGLTRRSQLEGDHYMSRGFHSGHR